MSAIVHNLPAMIHHTKTRIHDESRVLSTLINERATELLGIQADRILKFDKRFWLFRFMFCEMRPQANTTAQEMRDMIRNHIGKPYDNEYGVTRKIRNKHNDVSRLRELLQAISNAITHDCVEFEISNDLWLLVGESPVPDIMTTMNKYDMSDDLYVVRNADGSYYTKWGSPTMAVMLASMLNHHDACSVATHRGAAEVMHIKEACAASLREYGVCVEVPEVEKNACPTERGMVLCVHQIIEHSENRNEHRNPKPDSKTDCTQVRTESNQ